MSCSGCAALTATLDKVRAVLEAPGVYADKLRDARAALATAGAPDAGQPKRVEYACPCSWDFRASCTFCGGTGRLYGTPPEPKGPEQECGRCRALTSGHIGLQRDLAAANGLVTQLRTSFARQCEVTTERVCDLAAANAQLEEYTQTNAEQAELIRAAKARIAKVEGLLRAELKMHHDTRLRELAANARADAATANADRWATERDQLVARVRELEEQRALARDHSGSLMVERDKHVAQVERIAAIVSEMIPPQGIPGPSQRLLLRVREELGIGWPQ